MSYRILVAASNYKTDEFLLEAAVELAKRKGNASELLLLHVLPDGKPYSKAAEEALQQRANAICALGIKAKSLVAFGLAGRIICQYASFREWNADCIVIGHRDRSRWKALTLGSVSAYVKKHAPSNCEVLVIRNSIEPAAIQAR